MKKLLFLSILMSISGIISVAQPVQKTSVGSVKTDSSTVVSSKKNSESQSSPMAGASKSDKTIAIASTDEDEDFDEKELDELEISIAKAKAALGLKNVSTTTSSKSVSSSRREPTNKVEEPRLTAPTTTYQGPNLMLNGRSSDSNAPKAEFKQVALTEEEKKMYNTGGLKVKEIDEVDRDSIYISPSIPPSFSGGVEAMKAFFAQNLKVPQVLEGQEIKGRVFVRFVVRKDGRIDKVHLVKGPNDECNAEAIRVIKMMPNWLPASDKGDNVSAYHVLPISFTTKK